MERYPIGETDRARVEVRRVERADAGRAAWSVCMLVFEGDVLVRLPGHYARVLAERLRAALAELDRGGLGGLRRTYRDEFLDLTVVEQGDSRALVVSSSARSPLRVSVRLDEGDVEPLAALLEDADVLVETLRQGVSLVPDRLPDGFSG